MASSSLLNTFLFWATLLFNIFLYAAASSPLSLGHQTRISSSERVLGRRVLVSFKEIPAGHNLTFDCAHSGPCIPCAYSEKNDAKYRCSETGYRIPFECVEAGAASKEPKSNKMQEGRSTLETSDEVEPQFELHDAEEITTSLRHRSMLDDSSTSDGGSRAYVTYRSCIPAVGEETSVLGFEVIIFCIGLLSGSVVYYRKKRTGAISTAGAVRVPTNSRF